MSWANLRDANPQNDRVSLSPVALSDRNVFAKIAMDPKIWTHCVTAVHNESDLDRFIEIAIRDTLNGNRIVFVIHDRQTGEIVGSSAFGNISEADRKLDTRINP